MRTIGRVGSPRPVPENIYNLVGVGLARRAREGELSGNVVGREGLGDPWRLSDLGEGTLRSLTLETEQPGGRSETCEGRGRAPTGAREWPGGERRRREAGDRGVVAGLCEEGWALAWLGWLEEGPTHVHRGSPDDPSTKAARLRGVSSSIIYAMPRRTCRRSTPRLGSPARVRLGVRPEVCSMDGCFRSGTANLGRFRSCWGCWDSRLLTLDKQAQIGRTDVNLAGRLSPPSIMIQRTWSCPSQWPIRAIARPGSACDFSAGL